MKPTITAFANSPDRGRGLARDMFVRWALEEVGQPYEVRLLSFEAIKQDEHKALQPFGQIPTYQEGDLTLFESGAITLHIAERNAGLLPENPAARARAISWMFAAVSTVEPPIVQLTVAKIMEHDRPWHEQRLPLVLDRIRERLDDLARTLGDSDWLEEDFSAGDLMMIQVLRRLLISGMLDEYPTLAAYVARGEARPPFRRAFEAQYSVHLAASAAG